MSGLGWCKIPFHSTYKNFGNSNWNFCWMDRARNFRNFLKFLSNVTSPLSVLQSWVWVSKITQNITSEKIFLFTKIKSPEIALTSFRATRPRGPFLECPGNFSGSWSHSEISNLKITELFYSHTLNMNGGFLHTRSFSLINLSVFRYR